MSDHAWILENLAAYLTGGLEPAERERLEQHTADCAPCTAALNDARAMDVALSGLFAEARPSTALEDRVIQTLRNRPRDAWRLPLPGWLAVAAAALVLIGFTGAMANQILVRGDPSAKMLVGLSLAQAPEGRPNGSMASTLLGYRAGDKGVDELAEKSRVSMLSDLDEDTSRTTPNEEEASRGRIVKKGISDNTPSYRGAFGGRGAESRLGTEQKDDTFSKRTPPPPGAPSATPLSGLGLMDGSVRAVPAGGIPPPAASMPKPAEPASTTYATQPNYYRFEPGKQLESLVQQAAKEKPQDARARVGQIFEVQKSGGGQGRGETGKDMKRIQEMNASPPPDKKPPEQAGPRKVIIRTGEIEYEVQSFDAAVATIARLIKSIKSGFIATVNSDKLANGKVRGSVVVRVPPENLDELILDLRTNLGKTGELKNQRIGSQDITKQYTDLESELKAARAMEGRLLEIIKTGKGQIKDLLAAEKELGNWRTRIEKIEGELRYYASQVALSTLTITLYEKEIAAPFAVIEREQVQMGIEVEDVDQAYQAAQKAVREAKGRITRAELKQPSQGQFTALLFFEVAPEAAGPLRDRLKQLGTVARFDVSRQEETQGGAGKPSDAKTKRSDTRFQVNFYNLTDVAPRETVQINLASPDVEASLKTLLARVEKAAGRILASNLNSARGDQAQADLQFEVKSAVADAVLEDVKTTGEVMRLNVTESTNIANTTRKKRGFRVQLLALSVATARETDELQLACTDIAASYRTVQEAVLKAKGRIRIAQLNEQDRRNITATLDFEVRRADEDGIRAALLKAGAVYTRKVSRAADAENVVDSKIHWQITFINQANIPPRETYKFGVEVADVDRAAAMLTGLAGQHNGRTVEANISRERRGQITGKLVYDVPMAEVRELLDALKSAGIVRVQQSVKHPEVPDSSLAIARLDVTLSNAELIVPSDDGVGPSVRRGLSDSVAVLSWSLRILILGLCVLLPWALVIWAIYRLVVRLRRRSAPAAPAA